jgi:DNA-binding response OmpR family regulator
MWLGGYMSTILVIDDSDHFRSGIVQVLESEEYKVLELSDGKDLEEMLEKEEVDLILMDVVMPERGGVATMMDVKEKLSVPVVLMTGKVRKDSEAFQMLLQNIGSEEILYKPIRREELLKTISKYI